MAGLAALRRAVVIVLAWQIGDWAGAFEDEDPEGCSDCGEMAGFALAAVFLSCVAWVLGTALGGAIAVSYDEESVAATARVVQVGLIRVDQCAGMHSDASPGCLRRSRTMSVRPVRAQSRVGGRRDGWSRWSLLLAGCGESRPGHSCSRSRTSTNAQGDFEGPAFAARIDPSTLQPLRRRGLRLGDAVTTRAFSPARDQVAFGWLQLRRDRVRRFAAAARGCG
jgi:hypothetical protein